MIMKWKGGFRRMLSFFLAVLMMVMNIQFPAFADTEEYSTYCNGWTVQAAWSNLSTDYTWDATTDSTKQPKIVVTYRLENAAHDYGPHSLYITIPGIGNVNRSGLVKASDIAADDGESEWSYTWDQASDTYIFTNEFTVPEGTSTSGGFELLWTLDARDCENGYSQSISPTFSVTEDGVTSSITLEPLSFAFTSTPDLYRVSMTMDKLSAEDYDSADGDYVWYVYTVRFNKDWNARGVYKSDFWVSVEGLDSDEDYSNVVAYVDGNTVALTQNEDGEWGFYLYSNKYGNIGSQYSTYTATFRLGFLEEELEGNYITVSGHLSRLYQDESEWVDEAINEHDNPDASLSFTVAGYSFTYSGFIYSTYKYNTSYENFHYMGYSANHNQPSAYSNRLNAMNIYSGKVVEFTLYGRARRNYSSASGVSMTEEDGEFLALTSGTIRSKIGSLFQSLLGKAGKTDNGGFLATATKPGGNTSGISQVAKDGEYSLVLGDDKLAVFLNDGSVRNLEDDEYDISYVTIPATSGGYTYQVYGADTQDTHFDNYDLIQEGTVGSKTTVQMPEGIKAVYVRINGIVGSYSYYAYVGVSFHLDWDAEQEKEEAKRVDAENRIVDFSYLRALYTDEDGYEVNDCALTSENYGGTYGEELAARDNLVYEECMLRDYSNVWLRSPITNLSTTTSSGMFTGGGQSGFTTTLSGTGTIIADTSGELTQFSLYLEIPEGVTIDLDNDAVTISGSAASASGEEVTDFSNHASISTTTIDGKTVLVVDFDYSDNPLEISKNTKVSVSLPGYLTYVDYLTYGNKYTVKTYLAVHDEGLDKIAGTAVMADEYDLDGDGNTTEQVAYSSASKTVSDSANAWRQYVSKYVKSDYSNGYVTETSVKRYTNAADTEGTEYSYRLDFGLGALNAKNIIFYDYLETGAEIADNEDDPDSYTSISSAWQGTFVSVDTSYVEKMGMVPTVYYSTSTDPEFNLESGDWTTEPPEDLSTVTAVAVSLDTSGMEDGMMKTGQMAYVVIHMLAPSDASLVGTKAVNQYDVQYDAYTVLGLEDGTYTLPSSETYVILLDAPGKLILQKIDADNQIRTDSSGNPVYASLTGGTYQVYDSKQNALFDEPQSLNSLGRIIISDIEQGTYYWEEITAPEGYEVSTGLHTFSVEGVGEIVYMENYRIPGEVTLTKYDSDDLEADPLEGASYELFTVYGEQVFTDENYAYSESGTVSTFVTGSDGSLTVTGLPWGGYYFVETEAPEGYELNDSKVSFSIGRNQYNSDTNQVAIEVNAYNREKTASIVLVKLDAANRSFVKGATFTLYRVNDDGDDEVIKSGLKTNTAGEILVEDLKFGTYYFKETQNAPGYLMPETTTTDSVTLDVSTVDTILQITMTNERMKGSVELSKVDDYGYVVSGAVYELWYLANGETEYTSLGTYTMDDEGILTVPDLEWGDYYFLETSSPRGYDLNEEPIAFTINLDTVQTTVYLSTVDARKKGSVILTKVSASDPETVLEGAVYDLYFTDGTKCVLDTDYTLPNGENEIMTGADGTIQISGLAQGSYYLLETTAPANYTLSDELIRFSVTLESSEIVQELTAEDVQGKAALTVNKEVDSIYPWYGNPTFLFQIEQVDPETGTIVNTFYQAITLTENNSTGSVTLTVDQGYDYVVTEGNVSRYTLQEITTNDDNVTIDGTESATADLSSPYEEAEMTFRNDFDQYEKFSHVSSTVNMVKVAKVLTGITVQYIGIDPLTSESGNYDTDEEVYTIPNSDLTVTAIYDDGTERVLDPSEFTIEDPTVDGNDLSYTGTVSYTEGGTTKTGTFSVDAELPPPTPKYTVTFELNDGSIVKDGDTSGTAYTELSYQVKSGTTVSEPENDPTKSGYQFTGWYADAALGSEYDFTTVITADTTIYAGWEEYYDVLYAVSIYAIQDEDADGTEMALTFGPASGADYTGYSTSGTAPSGTYYVSHLDDISSRAEYESQLASGGDPCLHWMTWEEIIAQAKSDPTVFQNCLDNGCTHSVAINLSDDDGTAKKIRGTSYNGKMFGDGASLLYNSIASGFRKWNHEYSTYYDTSASRYQYGTNEGGWPDSAIRNMLTGTVTDNMLNITNAGDTIDFANAYQVSADDSLFGGFPEELKNAIYARAVRSNTVYNDRSNEANVAVTHDKLWLFSTDEYWSDASSFNSYYKNPLETADGSGTAFERQITLEVKGYYSSSVSAMAKLYYETGSSYFGWLRSMYGINDCGVVNVSLSGAYSGSNAFDTLDGVSPGFSIR